MRFRERRDENDRERPSGPDGQPEDALNEMRDTGEGFLAAGDEAIRKALSSDSEAFLRQNRQRGGQ
jgi:hypothetical protein